MANQAKMQLKQASVLVAICCCGVDKQDDDTRLVVETSGAALQFWYVLKTVVGAFSIGICQRKKRWFA